MHQKKKTNLLLVMHPHRNISQDLRLGWHRVGHDWSDLAAAADVFNLLKEGRGERCLKPGGASGKEPTCQCRRHKRHGFDPWVGKIPWRRAWQPTPVFLPGEAHRTEVPGGLQSMGLQRIRRNWGDLARTHAHALNERMLCVMLFYANESVSAGAFLILTGW